MTTQETLLEVERLGNMYARQYAERARLCWHTMMNDEKAIQLLYVMSNFIHCRKPEAAEVKAALREHYIQLTK
jgi:hypothetical protein